MAERSINCPECNGDLWEIGNGKAECTNCLYIRPFSRRSGNNGKTTPSQKKRVEQIRKCFDDHFYQIKVEKLGTTFQEETGFVYVNVTAGQDIWEEKRGHFVIGRKGGIKLLSLFVGPFADEDFWMKSIAKELGAKIEW